jgi:5-(carboxyamino)imidazole ribonucleotide mutase
MERQILVGVAMGSESDWPVMQESAKALNEFEIEFEVRVLSAHRTPDAMSAYAREAVSRGIKVIIAGAGGAAHLAGMIAANTTLPVIGVPVQSRALKGIDSLLSVVQMPAGVPVATVAIGGAYNAGILAAQVLATGDEQLRTKLESFKRELVSKVEEMDSRVRSSN